MQYVLFSYLSSISAAAFELGGDIQSLLSMATQLSQVLQDNGHNQLTLQCSTQVGILA